ncbi:MAG: amidohydrolase family protein [Chloroflexia bacterium]
MPVTAEVTPHHLLLTDDWTAGWGPPDVEPPDRKRLGDTAYDTSTKVNPPLRSEEHVRAVVQAVADGVIDAIATDHAPHAATDKECEYGCAAFGISGLETALGLLLTLVHRGDLDLPTLVGLLTVGPTRTFNLSAAGIREGARADLTLFDPNLAWVVDSNALLSKGKNTPLHGRSLRGKTLLTMAGERVYTSMEMETR